MDILPSQLKANHIRLSKEDFDMIFRVILKSQGSKEKIQEIIKDLDPEFSKSVDKNFWDLI
jgi:hypothetical protein